MIPSKTHFSCGCESDSTGVIKTCEDVLIDERLDIHPIARKKIKIKLKRIVPNNGGN